MDKGDRFVAAALLTQRDLVIWGSALRHVYPIEEGREFEELLREIDRTIDRRRAGKADD